MPASVFANPAAITLNDAGMSAKATPYPSTIVVSGLTGTISLLKVSLKNVSYPFADDLDLLLVGPGGQKFVLVSDAGGGVASISNVSLTLDDAAASTIGSSGGWGSANASVVFRPTDIFEAGDDPDSWPAPAPAGPYSDPAPNGAATLGSVFNGTTPNGTWSLYVVTDIAGDGTGQIAGGWSLDITTAAAAATTTTLASSNNPSFTSPPNNSVTLTATVSSSSSVDAGTVAFKDGATNLSCSGGNPAPVSAGTATCATSFATEGDHALTALYSGTVSFGPSSGSLTQRVDNHTTVNGNSYCNAGAIALSDPTANPKASPYASRIFVSGLAGTISLLKVSLKNVSYPFADDLDLLLVGPGGQKFVLVSDAGGGVASISNVSLTLDDAAASTIGSSGGWGSANASVVFRPTDIFEAGDDPDSWPAPAPAGPYSDPAPNGAATLGSVFNGTTPNGTWSLYVVTDIAGDGTGQIAGGWCVNITSRVTAVDLASFAARSAVAGVELTWRTAGEAEILGFHLWRSTSRNGRYVRVTRTMIAAAHAGTARGDRYSFLDRRGPNGRAFYRLAIVGLDGRASFAGAVRGSPSTR